MAKKEKITEKQNRVLHALYSGMRMKEPEKRECLHSISEGRTEHTNELTSEEADMLITRLQALLSTLECGRDKRDAGFSIEGLVNELSKPGMSDERAIRRILWDGFKGFLNKVYVMRKYQRAYFTYRNKRDLMISKKYEKAIDAELKALIAEKGN